MPYVVHKSGSGYKVFKKGSSKSFSKKPLTKAKAKAQQKALYASEAANEALNMADVVQSKEAAYNLEQKSLTFPSRNKAVAVYHYKSKKDNIDLFLHFTVGRTFEQIQLSHVVIKDQNDVNPKSNSASTEPGKDPFDSVSFRHFLQSKKIDIDSEAVLNAEQDALEQMEELFDEQSNAPMSAKPALKDPYEESLQFEKLFAKILSE
jgi:hypothetical protein